MHAEAISTVLKCACVRARVFGSVCLVVSFSLCLHFCLFMEGYQRAGRSCTRYSWLESSGSARKKKDSIEVQLEVSN